MNNPEEESDKIKKSLKRVFERSKQDVVSFFISDDPRRVRMTEKEARNVRESEKKLIIQFENFVQLLLKRKNEENSRNDALDVIFSFQIDTLRVLQEEVAKFSDQLKKLIESRIKRINEMESPSLSLVNKLNSPSFKEEEVLKMIDEAVVSWKRPVFDPVEFLKEETTKKLKELKTAFEKIIGEFKIDLESQIDQAKNQENQGNTKEKSKEFAKLPNENALKLQSLAKLKSDSSLSGVCLGNGGMALASKVDGDFVVLSKMGEICLTNTKTDTIKSKVKRKVSQGCLNSFVEVNPSQTLFLVGSIQEGKLIIYDLNSFKEKASWNIEQGETLFKARWIDEINILVAVKGKNYFFVYTIDQRSTGFLSPSEMKDDWVREFEVIRSTKELVCGTGDSHVVFKCSYMPKAEKTIWKHQDHKSSVFCIKISPVTQSIISASEDLQVIVTRETDGVKLAEFSQLSFPVIGISCSPDERLLVFSTYNQVALVDFSSKKLTLALEIPKEKLSGKSIITGAVGFWGKNSPPFVLIGCFDGTIWKMLL